MKRFVILLVDDNVGDRFLLKSMMEENNECQPIFIEASSGAEALILYEKEIADCVYLDFSMDDMTGIEFLEILHARNIQLIPTILISSHLQPSLVNRAKELGIRYYLEKNDVNSAMLFQATLKATEAPYDMGGDTSLHGASFYV